MVSFRLVLHVKTPTAQIKHFAFNFAYTLALQPIPLLLGTLHLWLSSYFTPLAFQLLRRVITNLFHLHWIDFHLIDLIDLILSSGYCCINWVLYCFSCISARLYQCPTYSSFTLGQLSLLWVNYLSRQLSITCTRLINRRNCSSQDALWFSDSFV